MVCCFPSFMFPLKVPTSMYSALRLDLEKRNYSEPNGLLVQSYITSDIAALPSGLHSGIHIHPLGSILYVFIKNNNNKNKKHEQLFDVTFITENHKPNRTCLELKHGSKKINYLKK